MGLNFIFVENRKLSNTNERYLQIAKECKQIFIKKNEDYGTSWLAFRLSSLTDQMVIKARRIRQLETGVKSQVDEEIDGEYCALVNYSVMALILSDPSISDDSDLSVEDLSRLYDIQISKAYDLMQAKNNDYGEAWRDLRLSSITDLILVKLLRIRRIEENDGQTTISEGISSNYLDIINYSIFALILLTDNQTL